MFNLIKIKVVWPMFFIFLVGCSSTPPINEYFGKPAIYAELYLRTNIQPWMDEQLKKERDWVSDSNLYLDGTIGFEWNHGIKCPALETGTAIFTGAPFHEKTPEDPQQELHWAYLKCGGSWGGK